LRALHFDGNALRLVERPEPEPLSDCVLVRVAEGPEEWLGVRVLAVGRHPAKLALLRAHGIETALAQEWRVEPAPLVV